MKQLLYQIWYDHGAGWRGVIFTPSRVLAETHHAFASYEYAEADAKRLTKRLQ